MMKRTFLVAFLIVVSSPAMANDSMAEIATGGLVLSRSDAVSMDHEELYISLKEIQVAYRFRNLTDAAVDTIVAFPMPDVRFNPYGDTALPDMTVDNFLGFSATVEGQPVAVRLEQRALAGALDVTDTLNQAGVPLFPFGDAAFDALKQLPDDILADWIARGLVFNDRYDTGDGMKNHPTPSWVLKSTYWWRMSFPAGQSIMVEHRYQPSVGATVGLNFFENGRFAGSQYEDYHRRYCIDRSLEGALTAAMKERRVEYPPYTEKRISYVLRTANNWAGGIGSFRVTIDKGSPDNLLSFCGSNIRKLTPTAFEMTITDFYPQGDFEVLFLTPAGF